MYYRNKLKPDLGITGLIPAIVCLAIAFIAFIAFGFRGLYNAVALFFGLYSLVSLAFFFLTRNISYLAAAVWQLLFGMYVGARLHADQIWQSTSRITLLITFFLVASTIWLFYLVFRRRAKWKGRELFELASLAAVVTPDGFTSRPRPTGRAEYSREDLEGFAEFLRRNLIAMPFREENRIVFVPVKGGDEFSYLLSRERFRTNRTWVAFDYIGNITVNISRRDYLDFKEELSFDQLCENLGKLFADFMNHFRKNEEDRIIYRLDELGLSLTS